MDGRGQRRRKSSIRWAWSGCCGSVLGGGSSANENFSPFRFGIGSFLGLFGNAAIKNKFVFRGVAQIYCHDDAVGVGAGFLVAGAGDGAELLRSLNTMTRRGLVISKYGAKYLGGFCEDFGGCLLGSSAIQHTTLGLRVDCEAE